MPGPAPARTWTIDDIAGPGIILGSWTMAGGWLVSTSIWPCHRPPVAIVPWAQVVLDRCPTYAEIQPERRGHQAVRLCPHTAACLLTEDNKGRAYHKGTEGTPPGATIPEGAESSGHKQPELGLYAERRYFTVTGGKLPDAPAELADITDAFAELVAMVNGWAEAPPAPKHGRRRRRDGAGSQRPPRSPEIVAQLLDGRARARRSLGLRREADQGPRPSGSGSTTA